MITAEVIQIDGTQAIRLPDGFRFDTPKVSIRRQGRAVIIEPVTLETWPPGFFEAIRITDPAFDRPEQGPLPPSPDLT